jgi:hypothetical protein
MITRKGQEEMVGFVLIILLVAIIFLVFLGLFLRKGNSDNSIESGEISQFLDSMLEYTSNCSLNSGYSYENVKDLATECERGALCSNNKEACIVLKETSKEIIESSWQFGSESPNKGYRFSIKFNGTAPDININSATGACNTLRGGSRPFQKSVFDLKICLD